MTLASEGAVPWPVSTEVMRSPVTTTTGCSSIRPEAASNMRAARITMVVAGGAACAASSSALAPARAIISQGRRHLRFISCLLGRPEPLRLTEASTTLWGSSTHAFLESARLREKTAPKITLWPEACQVCKTRHTCGIPPYVRLAGYRKAAACGSDEVTGGIFHEANPGTKQITRSTP